MLVNNINQYNTSFNGYIKFKNITIDANDIVTFATTTERKALTPEDCIGDEFIRQLVGENVYYYRYFNQKQNCLDWLKMKMRQGNNPNGVSMIGPQHEVSFHNGIIDYIKGQLKMKNGKKYDFEFQRIVTPPTLSKLTVYSGEIDHYNYPKAPIPKDTLTIDEFIIKAKKHDGILNLNTNLNGRFFNFLHF